MSQTRKIKSVIFNIFINNNLYLFANKSEICNYADDNTLYAPNNNINQNGSMITISY